ncbi:MAG: type II secretion system F family protein [Candidatus Pacebacteria bacterium]|nr:type II secretion system F family protein [Candidatus Paceibacterota bacterium]
MNKLRISGNDKIVLITNIATMLEAGIPTYEAIETLLEDAKGGQKKILEQLTKDLSAGHHIHTTFAKFPRVFNSISVNLIKASEEAGNLETTLVDLSKNLQKEMEFTDKIKTALTYPIIVMFVFVMVLFTMLVVVIPKISSVFSRLKVELPLPTKVLIFMSETLLSYWPYLTAGFVAFIILMIFLYNQKREIFLGVLFSLPMISRLMEEIDVTRFSRSMYLLLSSGIPFVYALELAREVIIKRKVERLIHKALKETSEGKQFSQVLKTEKNVFPSVAIKLIEVGEKTGRIESSMKNIAEKMDYTVSKSLDKVTALLEPIMLIFVGVVVGGMMMAIIAPIYGLIGQVGQR